MKLDKVYNHLKSTGIVLSVICMVNGAISFYHDVNYNPSWLTPSNANASEYDKFMNNLNQPEIKNELTSKVLTDERIKEDKPLTDEELDKITKESALRDKGLGLPSKAFLASLEAPIGQAQ